MNLTTEQRAALHHPRAAADYRDPLGTFDVIAAESIGHLLAQHLDDLGYRQAEGDDDEVITYRTEAADRPAARVPWRTLVKDLHPTVLAVLDDLSEDDGPGARRAKRTAAALRARERGAVTYLRRVTTVARESVEDADEDLIARAEGHRRPPRAVYTARPRPERRAANRAEDLAECRDLLARWVPTLPAGTHRRADVWAAFTAARTRSAATLAEKDHGALRLGERTFFALLADIGYPVTTGRARSRWLTIPAPPAEKTSPMPEPSIADVVLDRVVAQIADEVRDEIRARLRAGDRAGALVLHRDAHDLAATGTDGVVIDLAAARAARKG